MQDVKMICGPELMAGTTDAQRDALLGYHISKDQPGSATHFGDYLTRFNTSRRIIIWTGTIAGEYTATMCFKDEAVGIELIKIKSLGSARAGFKRFFDSVSGSGSIQH